MRPFILAFVSLMVVSTARAGDRYVEVWNPPEARFAHPSIVHKPVRHRRSAFHSHEGTARHKSIASIPTIVRPTTVSKTTGTPRPTFDDIPRQLTPEGNVLRVKGGLSRAEVER